MLQCERQQGILDMLEKRHTVSVRELAAAMYASEASVRRDIHALEQRGMVQRVYGGVTLPQYTNDVVPADIRESAHAAGKEKIAREAASRVREGDTVLMDSSSTVRRICRHIRHLKNIRIITNNLRICEEFRDGDVSVYCTGGAFYARRDCFLGPAAEAFLRGVNADVMFFSCQGLAGDGSITDVSEEEISIRRVMMERSARKIFLCDGSKLGVRRSFTLCGRQDVDEILCDVPLPFGWDGEEGRA